MSRKDRRLAQTASCVPALMPCYQMSFGFRAGPTVTILWCYDQSAVCVDAYWHEYLQAPADVASWHSRAIPQSITSMAGIQGARDQRRGQASAAADEVINSRHAYDSPPELWQGATHSIAPNAETALRFALMEGNVLRPQTGKNCW